MGTPRTVNTGRLDSLGRTIKESSHPRQDIPRRIRYESWRNPHQDFVVMSTRPASYLSTSQFIAAANMLGSKGYSIVDKHSVPLLEAIASGDSDAYQECLSAFREDIVTTSENKTWGSTTRRENFSSLIRQGDVHRDFNEEIPGSERLSLLFEAVDMLDDVGRDVLDKHSASILQSVVVRGARRSSEIQECAHDLCNITYSASWNCSEESRFSYCVNVITSDT